MRDTIVNWILVMAVIVLGVSLYGIYMVDTEYVSKIVIYLVVAILTVSCGYLLIKRDRNKYF